MLDGVIKYNLKSLTPPDNLAEFNGFSELEAWRHRLFCLNLIGEYPDKIGYGNLSMRSKNQSFYITATQTGNLPHLEVSDYPEVVSYNHESHSLTAKGIKMPSSEAPTHSAIYALDPEIQTIFHIHSAQIWQHLLETNQLATAVEVEYGTKEMAAEIARIYTPFKSELFAHNVFVMAGHTDGVFAFGQNCDQAGQAILRIYNEVFE